MTRWPWFTPPVRRGILKRVRRCYSLELYTPRTPGEIALQADANYVTGEPAPAQRGKLANCDPRKAPGRSTPAQRGKTSPSRSTTASITSPPHDGGSGWVTLDDGQHVGSLPHAGENVVGCSALNWPYRRSLRRGKTCWLIATMIRTSVTPARLGKRCPEGPQTRRVRRTPARRENGLPHIMPALELGPPPHAGGRLVAAGCNVRGVRSTPTPGENPGLPVMSAEVIGPHPRTPGETGNNRNEIIDCTGPPPHAGGKHFQDALPRHAARSTPARRGKTLNTYTSPRIRISRPKRLSYMTINRPISARPSSSTSSL